MNTWKRIALWGASIGFGIILAASLVLGVVSWWSMRPPKPPVWSDSAITAKFTTMTVQNSQDEIHMSYQYALTNHTNLQYSLPVAGWGSLMRRIPENKALDRFDDSSWDNSLIIPPGQTFNVKFNVIYKLSDYNTTTAELEKYEPGEDKTGISHAFVNFMNKRLTEADGLVFFDNDKHYRIELPRDWNRDQPKK
jgi:hypothetical protein